MTTGEAIKILRADKGITQQELSKMTGIQQSTISLYEKRNVMPNGLNVYKLCKALDVDQEQFYEVATDQEDTERKGNYGKL